MCCTAPAFCITTTDSNFVVHVDFFGRFVIFYKKVASPLIHTIRFFSKINCLFLKLIDFTAKVRYDENILVHKLLDSTASSHTACTKMHHHREGNGSFSLLSFLVFGGYN